MGQAKAGYKASKKHTKTPNKYILKMKLVSAATLFFTGAMADKWGQLGDLWENTKSNPNVNDDDRKIMELFTISSVANYGCWCRFNMYKPYKGPAQDTVDEACEQFHKNYNCLHIDYSTNTPFYRCGEDTPYVDVMTSIADPFDDNTDYETACASANGGAGNCESTACFVDAVFVRHIVNYLKDNTLNMTLSGWYGFDGSACRNPAAITATPIPSTACCGAYPDRFPYKTNSGARECCVDTTYNVNVLECCASGSLAVIGAC